MIRMQCDELCPGDCSNNWSYNDSGWKEDSAIEIACANSKGIKIKVDNIFRMHCRKPLWNIHGYNIMFSIVKR